MVRNFAVKMGGTVLESCEVINTKLALRLSVKKLGIYEKFCETLPEHTYTHILRALVPATRWARPISPNYS